MRWLPSGYRIRTCRRLRRSIEWVSWTRCARSTIQYALRASLFAPVSPPPGASTMPPPFRRGPVSEPLGATARESPDEGRGGCPRPILRSRNRSVRLVARLALPVGHGGKDALPPTPSATAWWSLKKSRPVVAQPLVEPRLPERPLRSKRTRACSREPAVVTRVSPPLALGPELVGRPLELKPGRASCTTGGLVTVVRSRWSARNAIRAAEAAPAWPG